MIKTIPYNNLQVLTFIHLLFLILNIESNDYVYWSNGLRILL